MPITEDHVKILWSIIRQQNPDGKLNGVDWNKVKDDIGVDTGNAASKRWGRLKLQLEKGDFATGGGGGGKSGVSSGGGAG